MLIGDLLKIFFRFLLLLPVDAFFVGAEFFGTSLLAAALSELESSEEKGKNWPTLFTFLLHVVDWSPPLALLIKKYFKMRFKTDGWYVSSKPICVMNNSDFYILI